LFEHFSSPSQSCFELGFHKFFSSHLLHRAPSLSSSTINGGVCYKFRRLLDLFPVVQSHDYHVLLKNLSKQEAFGNLKFSVGTALELHNSFSFLIDTPTPPHTQFFIQSDFLTTENNVNV
ncbi:hypothetical protein F2P56_011556, partial [Juglans regia]